MFALSAAAKESRLTVQEVYRTLPIVLVHALEHLHYFRAGVACVRQRPASRRTGAAVFLEVTPASV